jgi:hypothetical protein
MIVQIQFSEFIPAEDYSNMIAQSEAIIINAAVDYMMENMFPEYSESYILTPHCSIICDKVSEHVYIEIAPIWLDNNVIH